MTVPLDNPGDGALGLYSAVGDALAGRHVGFGRRRAALAARFASHRGAGDARVVVNWVAGLLAEIGHVALAIPPGTAAAERLLARSDAPLYGARFVAAIPEVAPAADLIRWHREHDDGTGFPDRLRWDGIPADAAALGLVQAFLEAAEDRQDPQAAAEALFALMPETGRRFGVELFRSFREFIAVGGEWASPLVPPLEPIDDDAALAMLAVRLDGRDARTAGRTQRVAPIAARLAERLGFDPGRGVRLARLLALGHVTRDFREDPLDPLSRLGRERRAADACRAATFAAVVPRYAGEAHVLAASANWYEDGASDPFAAILALALAIDALDPHDAPVRIAAAAGTQFDPAVTRAYLNGPFDGPFDELRVTG